MRLLTLALCTLGIGLCTNARAEDSNPATWVRCQVLATGDKERCKIKVRVSVIDGQCHLRIPKRISSRRHLVEKVILIWHLDDGTPHPERHFQFAPVKGIDIKAAPGTTLSDHFDDLGPDTLASGAPAYKWRDKNPTSTPPAGLSFDYVITVMPLVAGAQPCVVDPVVVNTD
jgi:hypothetical protein